MLREPLASAGAWEAGVRCGLDTHTRGLERVAGTGSSAREGRPPVTLSASPGLSGNVACGGATGAISHEVSELRAGPRGPLSSRAAAGT